MSVVLTILPIALVMAIGWGARASGLVGKELWPAVETLSFRLLIPAILIDAIARADLSLNRIGAFAGIILAATVLAGMAALLLSRRAPGPARATLFQTSIRFNGFISLAAVDLLIGRPGLALVAVSLAVLIPVINVASIVALVGLCGGTTGPRRIALAVVTNPLVIGSLAGIAINLGGGLPVWLADAVELVGRAALALGLLAVGAGIRLGRLVAISRWLIVGLLLRPVLVTWLFIALGWAVGLTQAELVAGVLIFAVPAAGNGYIITKAMGGDGDLYADVLAWQVVLSMAAIPAYVTLIM